MVLEKVGAPLALRDIELPKLEEGGALVRVRSNGICATDVKIRQGEGPKAKVPLVLGHEIAGEIVQLNGASRLKIGERVVVHPHIYCGSCQNCIEGMENVCMNARGSMGITLNGGLAEYVISPIRNLVSFPESLPFDQGALAGGTIAVSFSAIRGLGYLSTRTSLVLGTGALGFNAIQILKTSGAKVIVVGRKDDKLKIAKNLGADEVVNSITSGANYAEHIKKITNGNGVDVAFDFAGDSGEIPQLIRSIKRGGKLVLIGYSAKDFSAPYQSIALDALQIIGHRSYTLQDLRAAVDLTSSGKVKPIVDSTFTLEEANEALEIVKKGQVIGRAIINP